MMVSVKTITLSITPIIVSITTATVSSIRPITVSITPITVSITQITVSITQIIANLTLTAVGQWLWRSWQSGHFRYQRSRVRIQSSATFIKHLFTVQSFGQKETGNVPFSKNTNSSLYNNSNLLYKTNNSLLYNNNTTLRTIFSTAASTRNGAVT